MKVLVQRVSSAKVTVQNTVVGEIKEGLLLLVGFTSGDSEKEINYLVDKIINLRIFDDENGLMNKSLKDVKGSLLSVSQFTLYADAMKGRRPSYVNALNKEEARLLYNLFNKKLQETNIPVATGLFGADMKVSLTNEGPTTIILEKKY